jgi:hypothetical protein
MAKKKKAEISPVEEPQPAGPVVYRSPTHEALRELGFAPEASLPATDASGFAGKQGSTSCIWIYPGWKDSPKIEIILLGAPEHYFTIGPPGPHKEANPKHRVSSAKEFGVVLRNAGYPSAEDIPKLEATYKKKLLDQWEKDCDFARQWKRELPPKPK